MKKITKNMKDSRFLKNLTLCPFSPSKVFIVVVIVRLHAACPANLSFLILLPYCYVGPIPVAVRSKTWVFGRSLTRIVGSNPTGGMYVCLL
jgi:hypothetical protein